MKWLAALLIMLSGSHLVTAQVTEIVNGLEGPDALLISDGYLYVTEYNAGRVSKLNLNDPQAEVVTVVTGLDFPNGIYLNGNDLYISESGANQVSKIDITEESPEIIVVATGLSRPEGLAIKGDDLYISEYFGDKISKVNLSDSETEAVDVVTGVSRPSGIFLHDGELYIAEFTGNKVSKIDITDATPELIDVIVDIAGPYELVIDGEEIFVVQYNTGHISQRSLSDVNDFTYLAEGLTTPDGVVVYESEVYFSEYTPGTVSKISLDVTDIDNVETLAVKALYPNPSNDFITILNLANSTRFTVYDAVGVEMFNGSVAPNERIAIEKLRAGFYVLKLENGTSYPFVKE